MKRSIALLVLCVAVAVKPASTQTPESDVLRTVNALFQAMQSADSAAVRALLHPEARLIAVSEQNGEVRARITAAEGFIRAIAAATEELNERIWDAAVRIDGALAMVWASYDFHRGAAFSHCGVDAFHLAHTHDGWKIIEVAYTVRTQPCDRPAGRPEG